MTLKKHMLFWLEALLFINLANAITTIEINISPVFYEGDAIEFSYTVISSEDETIVYSAEVNCEDKNIPRPLLEIKDVKLKENEPFKETYIFGKVSSSFISGNCDASVTISEPYFLSEQSQFRIETSPIFKFTAQTCKDMSCTKKTKVFKKGETIYLAYSSSVEDISVTSLLTYPDKTTKQLSLPTSIEAGQIGTYKLEVTASKQGYKTMTKKQKFAVIEKLAKIKLATVCNANKVCDEGETPQNCPQDCRGKQTKKEKESKIPKTSKAITLPEQWSSSENIFTRILDWFKRLFVGKYK